MKLIGLVGISIALLAAAALVLSAPEPRVAVGIWGTAPEAVVLEVRGRGWGAEGAVTSIPVRDPVTIRVVGRVTCAVFATFVARPGSSWAVRLDGSGEASVTDLTAEGIDSGPYVGEVPPPPCDFADGTFV